MYSYGVTFVPLDAATYQISRLYALWFQTRKVFMFSLYKIVSEYDQEIPQSQTADNSVAPRGRA